MPQDRLQGINEQGLFYRYNFGRLLTAAYVLLAVIMLLCALIFYQHFSRPKPDYFVITTDGRLISIKPIEK